MPFSFFRSFEFEKKKKSNKSAVINYERNQAESTRLNEKAQTRPLTVQEQTRLDKLDEEIQKYHAFCLQFKSILDNVNELKANVRAKWNNNTLRMAYHYKKRNAEFNTPDEPSILVPRFFQLADDIFLNPANVVGRSFTQPGDKEATSYDFGQRSHVGYSVGKGRDAEVSSKFY